MDPAIKMTIIVTTLTILLFIGLVALLLVVNHNRRARHQLESAEMDRTHTQELRLVEKEVFQQTINEIGRELHDNIGYRLTVIRMSLKQLLRAYPDNEDARQAVEVIDAAIAEQRRLRQTLSTTYLGSTPLSQTLARECDRLRRAAEIEVNFEPPSLDPQMPADHRVVLFRIFQEVVNNILKHAGATRIDVELGSGPRLRIADNGRGLPSSALSSEIPEERDTMTPDAGWDPGQGLENIDRRARLIGYHCAIASGTDQGTTVTLTRHERPT